MKLVFGWELDGAAYPEIAAGRDGLGVGIVGPNGLMDILERWLGLGGPPVPVVLRVAQHLARVQAASPDEAFYAQSFAVDSWATARELLRWRDALVAGGWQGKPVDGGGSRLAAMTAIEAADLPLAPGPADRLRVLVSVLAAESRRPPIASITVTTPRALLPPPWPAILQRLSELGVDVNETGPTVSAEGDDIAAVRAQLAGQRAAAIAGDGSVVLLEADDPLQAAEVLASWFATSPAACDRLVLVRGGGSVLLDAAFTRLGLPRPGESVSSPLRGALQLLPLAFELSWRPLDPARVLELLLLPGSPIKPQAARRFARALREAPGIGGPAWQEAWKKALERTEELLEEQEQLQDAALKKRLTEIETEWRDWLAPPRFDPRDGMPAPEADRICNRVRALMQRRASATDDPLLKFAASVATALTKAITAAGQQTLSRAQLARMIDAVVAEGTMTAAQAGEASPWAVVDSPGQIWNRAETVVWWDFLDPGAANAVDPWSRAERAALARAGVALEGQNLALGRSAFGWRSAVANAAQRLLLVRPRSVAGAPSVIHPLWHEITAEREPQEVSRLIVDAGDALRASAFTLLGSQDRRSPLEPLAVPGPCSDWRVSPNRITPPATVSASSIEKLLGCRLAWTLHYVAMIRAGDLVVLPNENLMIGSLAHAIAAEIFGSGDTWDAETAGARARGLFARMVPTMAAPLALPGREVERYRAEQDIADAIRDLAALLEQARVRVIGCEVERSMPLDDSELVGRLDLICEARSGQRVVLDLKWSQSAGYREAELGDGRSVQLATYAKLEAAESGAPTSAGYFMLRQKRLLFLGQQPFPAKTWIEGPSLETVWQRVNDARLQILQSLAAGEITAEGDEMRNTEDLGEPIVAGTQATCGYCDYRQICGLRRAA